MLPPLIGVFNTLVSIDPVSQSKMHGPMCTVVRRKDRAGHSASADTQSCEYPVWSNEPNRPCPPHRSVIWWTRKRASPQCCRGNDREVWTPPCPPQSAQPQVQMTTPQAAVSDMHSLLSSSVCGKKLSDAMQGRKEAPCRRGRARQNRDREEICDGLAAGRHPRDEKKADCISPTVQSAQR